MDTFNNADIKILLGLMCESNAARVYKNTNIGFCHLAVLSATFEGRKINIQSIADTMRLSRSTVSRAMKQLEEDGKVRREKGGFVYAGEVPYAEIANQIRVMLIAARRIMRGKNYPIEEALSAPA